MVRSPAASPNVTPSPFDQVRGGSATIPGLVVVSEVWRSGRVESLHLGAAAVVDAAGEMLACAGDPFLASYLRSAAKPVQLVVMLELGLERAGALAPHELAVCAASHGGEKGHVEAVRQLLERIGLSATHLLCGAAPPLDGEAAREVVREGGAFTALHNNCSGKHAAMLATCRANGWPLATYRESDHPLQQAIAEGVAVRAGGAPGVGVDGCGVPTFFLALAAAARMTAALLAEAERREAAARVVNAMTTYPWYTSASHRLPYHLMRAAPGLLAKEGAEGFFVVGIPRLRSRWGRPVGLAMKVIDGAGEEARGREPAVVSALASLGVLGSGELESLAAFARMPNVNSPGDVVGEVRGVLKLDFQRG